MKTLWKVEVGSQIWAMDHEGSDHDFVVIYQIPTIEILNDTKTQRPNKVTKVDGNDVTSYEIGHFINLLIGGNINALQTILSTTIIQEDDNGFMRELQDIVISNPSKASFDSIHGIGSQKIDEYIAKGIPVSPKKVGQIMRVLNFGINLFKNHTYKFNPAFGYHQDDILSSLNKLIEAKDVSTLPEKPNESEFRNWLLKIRLHDLKEYEIINTRPLDETFSL